MYGGRYLEKSEVAAYNEEMEIQRQKWLKESIIVSSAKLRKLFNGKQYKLTKCFKKITDATRFIKMLRGRGDFARIVSYKDGHCVYWRLG